MLIEKPKNIPCAASAIDDVRRLKLSTFCLLLCAISTAVSSAVAQVSDSWRVMPIRTETEYNDNEIGGEGFQFPHGSCRSLSNPDIIYWSQDGTGPWKSVDGGDSWIKCKQHGFHAFGSNSIEVDPINPNVVIVSGWRGWYSQYDGYEGLYRSTDGGDTWTLVLQARTGFNWSQHRYYKHNIAFDYSTIDATGATTWYAALHDDGACNGELYKSTDYGVTWNEIGSDILAGHTHIHNIQVSADGTVYLASNLGLYTYDSVNGLQSKGDIPSGTVSGLALHPTNSNIVYAALNSGNFYKSINGGTNFSLFKSSSEAWFIFINHGYPDTIYAVETSNTYTTHDGGSTWGPAASNIEGKRVCLVPSANNPNDAVAYSNPNYRWYKTTDGGDNWSESNDLFTGYATSYPEGFSFDRFDQNRFALWLCDVVMARTTNGGFFWKRITNRALDQGDVALWRGNELPYWPVYCFVGDFKPVEGSETMVAAVGFSPNMKIMHLPDEATGWSLVTDSYELIRFMKWHPQNTNIVYSSRRISRDGGLTWGIINWGDFDPNPNAIDTQDPWLCGMSESQPDTIYALCNYGQTIIRSDDAGLTWSLYVTPGWVLKSSITGDCVLSVHPADPDTVFTVAASSNSAQEAASYNGSNWTTYSVLDEVARLSDYPCLVGQLLVDPSDTTVWYANVKGHGIALVIRSTDSGATWTDITNNLPRLSCKMAIHPITGEVFVNDVCGTWVFPPPYESENLIYNKCINVDSLGSRPPVANASSDQTIIDVDSNGSEQATLNGSASYDSDGDIESWVWTDDLGDPIDDGEITTAILSVGKHSITLTVTDDDGLSATDTVTITVDGEPKISPLETLFKNVIDIWFDRPLDKSLVEDPNNYTINYTVDTAEDSIIVHNVSSDPNLNMARLFTSTHSEDVEYTLKADFIQDEVTYTSNLVGDWRFDEYSSLEAKDSSCKGNTATLVNGPAWTGQGDLSFDGNDDAVEISTADLDADQGTISLWAYAEDFSGKQYLFSHSNQGATSKIQLYVLAGVLCLELGDSDLINWNEILDLQTWYHITLTWNGTTYAVYVNGVEKASDSYSGLTSLNTSAYIGNEGNNENNAFNGVIDNVKSYNLALTADAISDLFFSEEVKENKSLAFVVSPMDGLTYSVQNQQELPAGAVFDPNSNTFTWKPWYDQAGGCEVTFEGVDGSKQVQDTLTITAVVEDIELSSWYEQWLRQIGLL